MGKTRAGIYGILNTVNGLWYVGQSQDIRKRWQQHKNGLQKNKHENSHLQAAWNKYGSESFSFIVLCECSENDLDDKEIFWIDRLQSFKSGYNQTAGGGGLRGVKRNYEQRKNISDALKGKKLTEEHIANIIAARKRNFTEETRRRISDAQKGIHCKRVYCYELNTSYASTLDAEEQTGVNHCNISKAIKGEKVKTAGGYHWSYEPFNSPPDNYKNQTYRSVVCIETGIEYETVSSAAEATGASRSGIHNVLCGLALTSGGYHWRAV